jgi:hypothetical protein
MASTENFRPGFRISEIDVGVLMLGTLVSVLLARFDESFAVAILFTIAHFFLFCNVLRMSRPLELAWAALFVLLAASTILIGFPTWSHTFSVMLAVTAILAFIQVLQPSYHGAFWRRLNPNLPHWWAINRRDKH